MQLLRRMRSDWRAARRPLVLRLREGEAEADAAEPDPAPEPAPEPVAAAPAAEAAAPEAAAEAVETAAPAPPEQPRRPAWRPGPRARRATLAAALALPLLLAGLAVVEELRGSALQARWLSRVAAEATWDTAPGASAAVRFPGSGPHDRRLGYDRIPGHVEALAARGFAVAEQARWSRRHLELVDRGLFPLYRERTAAGLAVADRRGALVYRASYPERLYPSFESVPPLVVDSLLFIENRELLAPGRPTRNPAVEWDRLVMASLHLAWSRLDPDHDPPGGSTLATQLEKFRHSPGGVTSSPVDKLQQMGSAMLRAYRTGEDTTAVRRQITLDYLNSVPLAALNGYGEVTGLGDGLWAWYGDDFDRVNQLLRDPAADPIARARAYREVLSLFLAQRRPSQYLLADHAGLAAQTDRYLRLLAAHGRIPGPLARDALAARPPLRLAAPEPPPVSFLSRKGANAVRIELQELLGVPRLYDLDRLDLRVQASLDEPTQDAVTAALAELRRPEAAERAGLRAFRLLARGDPRGVVYSFTLHERTPEGNRLRVQTDNLDQPFNVNQGVKLELGSTAKLRTLVSYLEAVTALHHCWSGLSPAELREARAGRGDPIGRWAAGWLLESRDRGLEAMLQGALDRAYSASPAERFHTGGGLHSFSNFEPEDDELVMSVRTAFRRSVNLVFVRLMRDLVEYHVEEVRGPAQAILRDPRHPHRPDLLHRFADREGRQFLTRFHRSYRGLDAEAALARLLAGRVATAPRLAALWRYLEPDADAARLAAFLAARLPGGAPAPELVEKLHASTAPGALALHDRAFVAGVHPLELWTVAYLRRHPRASRAEVLRASGAERQAVYEWLYRTPQKQVQDQRIQTLLEVEAFLEIHRAWKRVGYPFDFLVPSLATAVGSSGDRPDALAELVGILLADGVRQPDVRIEELHFAAGTPFETRLRRAPAAGERVLPVEVARAARACLEDVVQNGTARRAANLRTSGGRALRIGGKTGTGDNRYNSYAPDGRLLSSRVVNRTASFVFFVDDRFFGVITAHVPGPQAEGYAFTSSLPVQIFKTLLPQLEPLLDAPAEEPRPPAPPQRPGPAEPAIVRASA